jgi:uncharacterized membrane protein YbhN (UPF0104 family)
MLMGQVLPSQLTTAAARGLGLMLSGRGTAAHGAGASLLEQVFDLLVALFCGMATAAVLLLHWGDGAWLIATLGFTLAGIAATRAGAAMLPGALAALAHRVRPASRAGRALATATGLVLRLRVLRPEVFLRLSALSVFRYAALIGTGYAAAWAGDLPVSLMQVAQAMPLVVLAVILSFAPGGLGVNEVTFVSALTAFGVPFAVAVQFALVNRVLNVAGAACVAGFAALLLLAGRRRAA